MTITYLFSIGYEAALKYINDQNKDHKKGKDIDNADKKKYNNTSPQVYLSKKKILNVFNDFKLSPDQKITLKTVQKTLVCFFDANELKINFIVWSNVNIQKFQQYVYIIKVLLKMNYIKKKLSKDKCSRL